MVRFVPVALQADDLNRGLRPCRGSDAPSNRSRNMRNRLSASCSRWRTTSAICGAQSTHYKAGQMSCGGGSAKWKAAALIC